MDRTDRRILTELQANARLSRTELGRRVGLSASAAADRLRRLEESGVILGYRAELDARAVGYPVQAIIRVRPQAGQLKRIADVAEATAEVIECLRVTGDDCYLLHIVLGSIDELEAMIDRFTPLGRTTTSIVNGTPVLRRPIPVLTEG